MLNRKALVITSNRITSNKSKHLLVENELKKIQKFDSSYFSGRSRFEEDGVQTYLVFQPMCKYFNKTGSTHHGNLKDCLMKSLNLLIIVLLQQ